MFKTVNNIYFVYEYCNGFIFSSFNFIRGTLEELIKKKKFLSETHALKIYG